MANITTNESTTNAGNQTGQLTFDITLKELNDAVAKIYYGADILLGVLILPGMIGNLHVLQIYIFKKPKNNTRIYVCFLAIIDLLSCGVAFPYNIVNCLLPYMFYSDFACKFFTFLNGFVTMGSALSLLVIAIERYRKICTPFKTQFTIKHAKLSCILVVIVTSILSTPVIFLYGSTKIPTIHPAFYGYECFVYTELRSTAYPMIYNGSILAISAALSTILIILYMLIGIHLWRQQVKMKRNKKNNLGDIRESQETSMQVRLPTISSSDNKENMPNCKQTCKNNLPTKYDSHLSDDKPKPYNLDLDNNIQNDTRTKACVTRPTCNIMDLPESLPTQPTGMKTRNKSKQTSQMTYMFFIITLCYFLSYIPYPILRLYQIFNMDWYLSLDLPGLIAFHTALCGLFINNVVNSFIYTVCDRHYREELKGFYAKLLCRN